MDDNLSVEQMDLVHALVLLRNKISEITIHATTEGPRTCDWLGLATILDRTATLCRREVILDG